MKHLKQTLMSAVAVGILAACTNIGAGMPGPRLTFENFQPVTLNVLESEVVEAYTMPNDPDDVSGQFVVAPSEAIKRYAEKRFPETGTGDGRFTIAIEDARVHLNELDEDNKVLKWAGAGKEDEYRLFLKLKVTMLPNGIRAATHTNIKMERTLVMPSSVTLAERETRQVNFMEKLMLDVDKAIIKAVEETPAIRQ